MKRICIFGLLGLCCLLSPSKGKASTTNSHTTNFWVLNVNYALKAYVQSGDQVLVGTVSTKQILNFISGATNRNNQIDTQTNVPLVSVTVSNSPFLITNGTGSYVISSNYVVTTNISSSFSVAFTNNIDFTNDVSFTEVTNEPLTYTFNNQVQVKSNLTLFLFPNLQAGPVTAVQTTNDPGVFELSGIVTNPVPIFQVMPDFSQSKGAKLVCVAPIVDVTNDNFAPKFQVRYSVGGVVTNVDVSDFIFDEDPRTGGFSTVRNAHIGFAIPQYGLRQIGFDATFSAQPGPTLTMVGLDQQARGAVISKGKFAAIDVPRQRRLAGGGQGTLTRPLGSQNFTNNTCVLKGAITFSGGRLEPSN